MNKTPLLPLLCLCAASALSQTTAPAPSATDSQQITVTTTAEPMPLAESDRAINLISPARPAARRQQHRRLPPPGLLSQSAIPRRQRRPGRSIPARHHLRAVPRPAQRQCASTIPRPATSTSTSPFLSTPSPASTSSTAPALPSTAPTPIGGAVNLLTQAPPAGASVIASFGGGSYGSLEEHLRQPMRMISSQPSSPPAATPPTASSPTATTPPTPPPPRPGSHSNPAPPTSCSPPATVPTEQTSSTGPYDSWERTKGWLASIQQQLGAKTAASFGYRRHSDLYVLFVDQPDLYENNHITSSYEGALRRADTFGHNATLSYGLEADATPSTVSTSPVV